jgi:hypothetical protein
MILIFIKSPVNPVIGCYVVQIQLHIIIHKRDSIMLRAFESWVLGMLFGTKGEVVSGDWRKFHNESFVNCTFYKILFRVIKMRLTDYV